MGTLPPPRLVYRLVQHQTVAKLQVPPQRPASWRAAHQRKTSPRGESSSSLLLTPMKRVLEEVDFETCIARVGEILGETLPTESKSNKNFIKALGPAYKKTVQASKLPPSDGFLDIFQDFSKELAAEEGSHLKSNIKDSSLSPRRQRQSSTRYFICNEVLNHPSVTLSSPLPPTPTHTHTRFPSPN